MIPAVGERLNPPVQPCDPGRPQAFVWPPVQRRPAQNRPAIAQQLAHWLEDTDLSGVRREQALAKLPEAERQRWRTLWADVAATLARSQEKGAPPGKKTAPKAAPKQGGANAAAPPASPG